MRVVMVEDHEVVRSGLRLLLESLGMSVEFECDGIEPCLRVLSQSTPDLVLVDLKLADGCGLELTRQLSALYPGLPVLILSTYDDIPTVVQAIQAGASGYLVKSATSSELHMALKTVSQGGCYIHPKVSAPVLARLRQGVDFASSLTPRQSALLACVTQGLTNPDIAARLHISLSTVKSELSSLYQQFGVSDRTQLAVAVTRQQGGSNPSTSRSGDWAKPYPEGEPAS
jgi:DNA-binding NarL/FixJ family response regulator